MRVFHVSPAVNRESIARFGLDPKYMGAALGIAGSPEPEEAGVFVARDIDEIVWFFQMGEGRHPALDIWEVTSMGIRRLGGAATGRTGPRNRRLPLPRGTSPPRSRAPDGTRGDLPPFSLSRTCAGVRDR